MNETVSGSPTKEFFVEMLTRDIDLSDAILDLLDNCLDGVVRKSSCDSLIDNQQFYTGYCAEISISSKSFSIKDNCGGIPRATAKNYAFRMGRVSSSQSEKPTIGIYGIGMKRAIFKIGRAALVHTKCAEDKYTVVIPKNWVSTNGWDFEIDENNPHHLLNEDGTEIVVSSLNSSILGLWKDKASIDAYIEHLRKAIQDSYSLIIQKGFTIKINGLEVKANPIELLALRGSEKNGIRPYLFTHKYDNVLVKLAIGFYSPMASDAEIEEINESRRSSLDAGITVVCNDRIVLYNDKSSMTGWGTNSVPNYHTQFIGIKGIVIFESSTPKDLPMTTTKRGVDHSSHIYLAVKDKICEGLKMFTNYTNQWKGRNEAERKYSNAAEKVSYSDLFSEKTQKEFGLTLRHETRGDTYRPSLPAPINDKPFRVIRFTKPVDSISAVKELLYGDPEENVSPSTVGEKCFDRLLAEATKGDN